MHFLPQNGGAQPRIRGAPWSRFEALSGQLIELWMRFCWADHELKRHLRCRLIALDST